MHVVSKIPSKKVNYSILLTNNQVIPISCEKYETVFSEDYEPIIYKFLSGKVVILELEANRINCIISNDDADTKKIIKALKIVLKPKPKIKKEVKID